jgi:hypothetical protein
MSGPADGPDKPRICLEELNPRAAELTVVPGTSEELSDDFLADCRARLDELRARGGDPGTRTRVGGALYRLIESTEAGREWLRRCKDYNKGEGRDPLLHSYLDIEHKPLQHLPWELMTGPAEENAFAPFRSGNHLPVRGTPSSYLPDADPRRRDGDGSPLSDSLPLSVLVAVYDVRLDGLTTEEITRAEPQAEIDGIFDALRWQPGMWQVEILPQPTELELKEALETFRPQILHFIGEPSGQANPEFTATRRDGTVETLRISDLKRIIREEISEPPRLFILNGCRTADMAPPERFRDLGFKAVITNQATVWSPPAITFIHVVYEQLAATGNVAKAVREARVRLWALKREDHYHWGIPVLTTYSPPENVIRDDLNAIKSKADAIINTDLFSKPHNPWWHIDRLRPSLQVWRCVGSRKKIALIKGPENSGKSLLLRMCMLTWKLRGHPAVLFDPTIAMPGDRRLAGVQSILLHICNELRTEFDAFPQTILDRLDILIDKVASASFIGNGLADDTFPYEQPCQEFISILSDAATDDRPLMLAFDSLHRFFAPELRSRVRDHIFLPIVMGKAGSTYLAIAVKENEWEMDILGWENDFHNWEDLWVEEVDLVEFEAQDAIPFGHEFGARMGLFGNVQARQGYQEMVDWLEMVRDCRRMRGLWFPIELKRLAKRYRAQRRLT